MPFLDVHTNMPTECITDEFRLHLSRSVSEILGGKRVTMRIKAAERLTRGYDDSNTLVNVHLYGGSPFTNIDDNRKYVTEIADVLTKGLDIPDKSITVMLHHLPATHCGMGDTLLIDQLKARQMQAQQK